MPFLRSYARTPLMLCSMKQRDCGIARICHCAAGNAHICTNNPPSHCPFQRQDMCTAKGGRGLISLVQCAIASVGGSECARAIRKLPLKMLRRVYGDRVIPCLRITQLGWALKRPRKSGGNEGNGGNGGNGGGMGKMQGNGRTEWKWRMCWVPNGKMV